MINDGYGFDAGEEVIVGVGERLAKSLRASDIIGRTAGNKFGVILRNCKENEIEVVAARLKRAVREHAIETRAGKVSATTSVGAVWLPLAAATSQEAMLRAEQALERARVNGRDGFAVYAESPQRDTARLRQMGIADEVTLALKENRIRLAYQPIVDAKTRKSVHYECLLRMLRPDGQEIAAGYFVPATEHMGIVHLVDRFALETAVAQLKRHDEIHLGVNVSGTAALDPVWLQSFVDHVARKSRRGGPAGGGAHRNRVLASVRGECPVCFAIARIGSEGGDRRFRCRLHVIPQFADDACRCRQDRRLLYQGPVGQSRKIRSLSAR